MLPWPIKLYGDNQVANALTRNPESHQRTKHIDIGHRFITSLVTEGSVSVSYVPTDHMLADMFTKPLPTTRHELHCQLIGLCFTSELLYMQCCTPFNSCKGLRFHIMNETLNGATTIEDLPCWGKCWRRVVLISNGKAMSRSHDSTRELESCRTCY